MFASSLFINTHPRLSVYHRMYGKEADIWQIYGKGYRI